MTPPYSSTIEQHDKLKFEICPSGVCMEVSQAMKRFFSAVMILMILSALVLPASAATHGTMSGTVTENMVNNVPPADYQVNTATQAKAMEGLYNAFFLKDALQTVEITVDEYNLNYLLQNAVDEPYVMTRSVTIGGTTLGYCGLKTKGNYTLYHAYHDNPGSDRFSFTVNFGKYITKASHGEKQNFYGCEKISFNNFFFDKSMLKEYCALMLMEELGLPTPQFGLAKLYINGEYYGVYFMVEAFDETILEQHWRVSGKDLSSYLVKPAGTNFNYQELVNNAKPLYENDEETYADVADMLPTVMDWSKKLTSLSQGKDFSGNAIDVQSEEYVQLLSQILDLDEVIRYFAASSWLCQLDNMFTNFQNFGMYVSPEGKATLIPWDYDLAFGCYYPSTAQNTANYPVDVMYRLDLFNAADEAKQSARTYKDFPLFNVIYQNDALMEKYHAYMAECSQIAALGGTVASTGKSYAPAYLNSCIETLSDALIAAAAEKTADNVYYMNFISQPNDVKKALPNISAIIAQRAVGVWSQVCGNGSTVCGGGCNLETLGNAILGEYANSGELITVDPATGIFASASYSGGRRAASPVLKVTALAENSTDMEKINAGLTLGENDIVTAWMLSCSVKAASSYTLTVPLAPEYLAEGATLAFYTYADGVLTPLTMEQAGNLFTCRDQQLGTVVLHAQGVVPQSQPLPLPVENNSLLWILVACGGVLAAAGIATAVIFLRKKRKAA